MPNGLNGMVEVQFGKGLRDFTSLHSLVTNSHLPTAVFALQPHGRSLAADAEPNLRQLMS